MSAICRIGKLLPKTTAVFLCDMQEKFANSIQYFPQIVNVSSRLLKAAKTLDMAVVVTEQNPKGLGPTVEDLGLHNYSDIKPYGKTQFSMLIPDVEKILKEQNPEVKNIVLCGIEAHVCIQGTALALLEKGYDVHVVVDACSSRTMVDRMFAFQRMKDSGAYLTTSESVILALVGDFAHPKFKTVQQIIKEPAPDSGLLSLLPMKSWISLDRTFLE